MVDEEVQEGRRRRMVESLLAEVTLSDPRVVEALLEVPRHHFLDGQLVHQAYGTRALPIAAQQTISSPAVVARMTETLRVEPQDSVLEVGTGSGYQTAILARLARRVFSLERLPELARRAVQRMRQLRIDNVKIQVFDGSCGWAEMAPFDRIIVTAGTPQAPPPLLAQLAERGRLLVPEGALDQQRLVLYEKLGPRLSRLELGDVAFVPLLGKHGWSQA
jgi:protein-L-isoaspartate(D-aspartate) O-methyltransferase